jgi:phytanoyl-CoA dioxygenase PhyH
MVFDDSETEHFISDGYVVLRRAFSREVAEECREFVWKQVRLWEQCTTYSQPMVQVQKGFGRAPFDRIMNARLASGLDQIVGANRWRAPEVYGWWSLLFPGFPGPGGWHVDGGRFRTSGHLTDHHHALVTLFLFSDVGFAEGGTAMIRGSHLTVARAIAAAGDSGISWNELQPVLSAASVLSPDESQIVHLVGAAGDVALMHPFLIHGFGANQGSRIRFACNPLVQLNDLARLERADREYSAVEMALRKAVGLE